MIGRITASMLQDLHDYRYRDRALAHMTQRTDPDELRKYIKQFVLARAHAFRVGHEDEDAWSAILQAKTSYKIMNRVVEGVINAEREAEKKDVTAAVTATEVMARHEGWAKAMARSQREIDQHTIDVLTHGMPALPDGVKIPIRGTAGMKGPTLEETVIMDPKKFQKLLSEIKYKTAPKYQIIPQKDKDSWLAFKQQLQAQPLTRQERRQRMKQQAKRSSR